MDKKKCCPPPDVRGKAFQGSVLTLDAIGPQDKYCVNNQNSNFVPTFTRAPGNAIYQRQTQFGEPTTTYFGSSVRKTLRTKEMGDVLSNMYLKTKLPALSENVDGTIETINFPFKFSNTISAGESFSVENAEIKNININSSNLEVYNNLGGFLKNGTIKRNINQQSDTNAQGVYKISSMTLGTKIIDQEIFKTVDPSDPVNFELSVNVSTQNTTVINGLSVDGGLKNLNFFQTNRDSKERFFEGRYTGNTFSFSDVNLFKYNDIDFNINWTDGTYSNLHTGSYSNVSSNIKPCVLTVVPKNTKKFRVPGLNVSHSFGGSGGSYSHSTNVACDNTVVLTSAGSTTLALGDLCFLKSGSTEDRETTLRVTKVDSTNFTFTFESLSFDTFSHGAAGVFAQSFFDTNKRSSTFTYNPGTLNKSTSSIGYHDTLAYISFAGSDLQSVETGASLVDFGDEVSLKWRKSGSFVHDIGGRSLLNNDLIQGSVTRVNLHHSPDYCYFRTTADQNTPGLSGNGGTFHGLSMVYNANYNDAGAPTKITDTQFFSYNVSGTSGKQIWNARGGPKSIVAISNASVDNQISSPIGSSPGESVTTPPGARFQCVQLQLVESRSDLRLDGSLNPFLKFSAPNSPIQIIVGGTYEDIGNSSFSVKFRGKIIDTENNIYEDFGGDGDLITYDSANNATQRVTTIYLPCGKYGPNVDNLYSNTRSVGCIYLTTNPVSQDASNVNMHVLSNLHGTSSGSGSTPAIDFDANFARALQFGGLKIDTLGNLNNSESNVFHSFTTLDFYTDSGTTLLGGERLNVYSNVTTIDYSLDSNLVTVTNAGNSVTITNFDSGEYHNIVSNVDTYHKTFQQSNFTSINPGGSSNVQLRIAGSSYLTGDTDGKGSNIHLEPVELTSSITISNNGYANIVTSGQAFEDGPFRCLPDDTLELNFYPGNTASYSNVIYVGFSNVTIPQSNLKQSAINSIVDATMQVNSGVGGSNVVTYLANNFVEIKKDGSNVVPVNTMEFTEPGYDIYYTVGWDALGNVQSTQTSLGSFSSRQVGYRHDQYLPATSPWFANPGTTTITVTDSNSQVEAYMSNASSESSWTSISTSASGASAPFSLLGTTLSTGNRENITYETTDATYNRLSILPPSDLTFSPGTNNVFVPTNTKIYSGPTFLEVNETNVGNLFGSSKFSSNLSYTTGKITAFINGVENVSTTVKTYSTDTEISFGTYSNTLTVGSNTQSLADTFTGDNYKNFLLSNTSSYNINLNLGDSTASNLESSLTFSDSAAFSYKSNVYIIGGSTVETRSSCFKVSSDPDLLSDGEQFSNGLSVFQIDFGFKLSKDATAALDTDNFNAYVLNDSSLYRINFNETTHALTGEPELVSDAYFYKNPGSVKLTYHDGKIYAVSGFFFESTQKYKRIDYFDISRSQWANYLYSSSDGWYFARGDSIMGADNKLYFAARSSPSLNSFESDQIWQWNPSTPATAPVMARQLPPAQKFSTATFGKYGTSTSNQRIYIQSNPVPDASNTNNIYRLLNFQNVVPDLQAITIVPDEAERKSNLVPVTAPTMVQLESNNGILVIGGIDGNGSIVNDRLYVINSDDYTQYNIFYKKSDLIFRDASFVGSSTPGSIPEVQVGLNYNNKVIPLIEIEDNNGPTTDRLVFNLNRHYVNTAFNNSSRENKGFFNSWQVELQTSNNIPITPVAWDGRDANGNWSQTSTPGGPVWPADALNSTTLVANFYSSNIIFDSTISDLTAKTITFQTSNSLTHTNPRSGLVPNFVKSSNINYSDFPSFNTGETFSNNFFNFSLNGSVPMNSSKSSKVIVKNRFNPFVKENFDNYPSIEVHCDTDNIYKGEWSFSYNTLNSIVTPPFDTSNNIQLSNVVGAEVYRQYNPTIFKKEGRLEQLDFKYGISRNTFSTISSLTPGILRRDIRGSLPMSSRKLVLASISVDGNIENEASKIEIYKYFPSVAEVFSEYGSNVFVAEQGGHDEIIVSFGASTTASGVKEYISIKPGNGRATSSFASDIDYTLPDDDVKVTFTNYDVNLVTVDTTITYTPLVSESGVITKSATISLKPDIFNKISDINGTSGPMFITSIHNAGIVSSNIDGGSRPILISNSDEAKAEFSTNLLSTCLTSFKNADLGIGFDASRQQNVMQSVFPMSMKIRKVVNNGVYTDRIGRAIIKSVKFSVQGQEIETLDDLWYTTNDELNKTDDEKKAQKFMLNCGEDYLPTSIKASAASDLYIPLDFFFCRTRKTSSTDIVSRRVYDDYRSYKPFFPLCALTDQEIDVDIEFYPKSYFTNSTLDIDLSYKNTFLVTEEALISPEEKMYMKNTPLEFQIETVTKLPQQVMDLTRPNIQQRFEGLVADYPVKMINWFFRSVQFENINDSKYFLHRYNFSTVVSDNDRYKLFFEIMKDAKIYYEGVSLVEKIGSTDFYRFLQALQSSISASTNKNIYSYSFALSPTKTVPSGSLNLSETTSNKTFISFNLEAKDQSSAIERVDINLGATIHAYVYGYNVLKIENNNISKLFS